VESGNLDMKQQPGYFISFLHIVAIEVNVKLQIKGEVRARQSG